MDSHATLIAEISKLKADLAEARQWVNDLQSGMYINCVYCGHRYGPNTEVAASMADVLKQHVEQCPKHPMSKLKAEIAKLKADIAWMEEDGDVGDELVADVVADNERLQEELAEARELLMRIPAMSRTQWVIDRDLWLNKHKEAKP